MTKRKADIEDEMAGKPIDANGMTDDEGGTDGEGYSDPNEAIAAFVESLKNNPSISVEGIAKATRDSKGKWRVVTATEEEIDQLAEAANADPIGEDWVTKPSGGFKATAALKAVFDSFGAMQAAGGSGQLTVNMQEGKIVAINVSAVDTDDDEIECLEYED